MAGMPVYEKMSKSRGNVITPDEVVHGVAELAHGFVFRGPPDGRVIDYLALGVWRDSDGMYYTSGRHGKQEVFLCHADDVVPPMLLVRGEPTVQHLGCTGFWMGLLDGQSDPDVWRRVLEQIEVRRNGVVDEQYEGRLGATF